MTDGGTLLCSLSDMPGGQSKLVQPKAQLASPASEGCGPGRQGTGGSRLFLLFSAARAWPLDHLPHEETELASEQRQALDSRSRPRCYRSSSLISLLTFTADPSQ